MAISFTPIVDCMVQARQTFGVRRNDLEIGYLKWYDVAGKYLFHPYDEEYAYLDWKALSEIAGWMRTQFTK